MPKKIYLDYQATTPVSKEILDAAQFHTTGSANMSLLAEILFVADYIERGRTVSNRKAIESLSFVNIKAAVFAVANQKLLFLIQSKKKVHPYLLDCYNFYLRYNDTNYLNSFKE